MIGYCGICGTPLQRLPDRPPPGSDPGQWVHSAPIDDSPELAAVKAHMAIVHDDYAMLPPIVKSWQP